MSFYLLLNNAELRIKALMAEKYLSQADLTEVVGVSQGTISAYLKASFLYRKTEAISELLGVSATQMLFGDDRHLAFVVDKWANLTPAQKKMIASHIEVLTEKPQ